MISEAEIPLQRGLNYYFENQAEFDRKELPEEKRVALGFEAGIEIGKCLMKIRVAGIFKPDSKMEWA